MFVRFKYRLQLCWASVCQNVDKHGFICPPLFFLSSLKEVKLWFKSKDVKYLLSITQSTIVMKFYLLRNTELSNFGLACLFGCPVHDSLIRSAVLAMNYSGFIMFCSLVVLRDLCWLIPCDKAINRLQQYRLIKFKFLTSKSFLASS